MTDERERADASHLEGVEDGCGCAEVWEHLSGSRESESENGSGAESDADADSGTDADTEDAPAVAGAGDP